MGPLLNVAWQQGQMPVEVCLGMMGPFLVPGARWGAPPLRRPIPRLAEG